MSYTISEGWGTEPSTPQTEFGIYTVHNDDCDGIEKTFRWYSDAERYRDTLNEVTSAEATVDPDEYRDLLIDDQLGVR